MPRSPLNKLAALGAVCALFGTSACATAEDEALLLSFLGLAAVAAISVYKLYNCCFHSSDYAYVP